MKDQLTNYTQNRTPAQCRNGPILDHHCTDCPFCILYLLLIASVIFFLFFCTGEITLSTDEIQNSLQASNFGNPLLAIIKGIIPIIIALAFVAAICLLLVITTFTIPLIATYIYIPLFLLLMLFAGIIFLIRYFGQTIPFVSQDNQSNYVKSQSVVTLIIGLAFLIGFLAAVITIFTKRSKFANIMPILKISRIVFWNNFYVFIFSFIFTIISIGALVANVIILGFYLTRENRLVSQVVPAILVIIEGLWTHGFLQALSDFFFQSIAIHWYYKKRRQIQKQQTCCFSLSRTIKLTFIHIGTIVFGHILAYIPETLNTMLGRCEKYNNCCYSVLCCWHRFTFRYLTKYCYFETIMQSLPFCTANSQMFGLRQRTKAALPQIYMMGNFYITLAKIFSVMCGLIICYFLIGNSNSSQIFNNPINILGPMIVVFLASLQISNHFMNLTGLMGDTIVFAYQVDVEIQKQHFGEILPYNCPASVCDIINEIKARQKQIY